MLDIPTSFFNAFRRHSPRRSEPDAALASGREEGPSAGRSGSCAPASPPSTSASSCPGARGSRSRTPGGETTILDILGPGSLFAHGYACSMEPSTSTCWQIRPARRCCSKPSASSTLCPKQCGCHAHISSNLMRALALSSLDMNRRAIAMTPQDHTGQDPRLPIAAAEESRHPRLRHPLQPNQAGKLPSASTAARCRTSCRSCAKKASSTTKAARTGSCSAQAISCHIAAKSDDLPHTAHSLPAIFGRVILRDTRCALHGKCRKTAEASHNRLASAVFFFASNTLGWADSCTS